MAPKEHSYYFDPQNPPERVTISLHDGAELVLRNPGTMVGARFTLTTRRNVSKFSKTELYLLWGFWILCILALACFLILPWVKGTSDCPACETASEEVEFEYCLYKYFGSLRKCFDGMHRDE